MGYVTTGAGAMVRHVQTMADLTTPAGLEEFYHGSGSPPNGVVNGNNYEMVRDMFRVAF